VIKILDVGSQSPEDTATNVSEVFKELGELEIVRVDIRKDAKPDLVHDITKPFPKKHFEAYDIVMASHVMEHIDRMKVMDTMQHLYDALKVGGELYVIVPSLEWAATEIYFGRNTHIVQATIFGGQNHSADYHHTGFTLDWLRFLVENMLHMSIRKAYSAPFTIESVDEEGNKSVTQSMQDVVIGLKVELEDE
jgi:predicted SAM-dependent methyltransferase